MDYRRAIEVEEVARELIEEHHRMLQSHGPRIVYVMTQPPKNPETGRDYKIHKITGVNAFLANGIPAGDGRMPTDFGWVARELVAIEVKEASWNRLSAAQQEGLVDHLLSHLSYDLEKDNWTIEPPEFGEFQEVLERHGFWRPGRRLREFAEAMSEQLSLLDEADTAEQPEAEDEANAEPAEQRLILHEGEALSGSAR